LLLLAAEGVAQQFFIIKTELTLLLQTPVIKVMGQRAVQAAVEGTEDLLVAAALRVEVAAVALPVTEQDLRLQMVVLAALVAPGMAVSEAEVTPSPTAVVAVAATPAAVVVVW
jgi:hypothetical protein